MDASGGTGIRGYAGVSERKQKEFNAEYNVFTELKERNDKKIKKYQASVDSINNIINVQTDKYRKNLTEKGILIRYEAFDELLSEDKTGRLSNRYYLLMAILIVFELIPLIAKYYIQDRSYQEKRKLIDTNEIEIAQDNASRDLNVKKERNRIALEKDIDLIKILFEEVHPNRTEETKRIITDWKTNKKSFDELWRDFKKQILSKQES
ncbi:MAG: DUF4407 domain-containing protein [Sphingobacteriales bacterium JAD_PAG50586_3]|nr:MAG: DUF4407 domain-containing protein [Sphingobacteriales bacterium JAD_PAG50586_3]